jgi:hypothetical protein
LPKAQDPLGDARNTPRYRRRDEPGNIGIE